MGVDAQESITILRSLPKPGVVAWPFTSVSVIYVERKWAADIFDLYRKLRGNTIARKAHAHFLAANGRPFKWPVWDHERDGGTHGR